MILTQAKRAEKRKGKKVRKRERKKEKERENKRQTDEHTERKIDKTYPGIEGRKQVLLSCEPFVCGWQGFHCSRMFCRIR